MQFKTVAMFFASLALSVSAMDIAIYADSACSTEVGGLSIGNGTCATSKVAFKALEIYALPTEGELIIYAGANCTGATTGASTEYRGCNNLGDFVGLSISYSGF
ncbi:hypothetical protein BAUCODRAFT_30629 [Baudoinia panamericana UAMH 10762]|uniref:Cyanovirin-N domain-containing protein n=1 Tax=Baudoinia panamericana (strain UAMH 10762) TaxID=717646 RepID=M2MTD5_BAUPA|nr:uncharacterized protein BAUCODRAFT_30629 [Baudoinia panamericana UAMH 10762]EMD00157.1 hypothetical protein BAUCODRAFT_30629 [Baudoinia panamericana UAMH 10762]